MAYRVYMEYPFMKGKWFPHLEQRKYLEDAKNDLWLMRKNPFFKKFKIRVKIVHEPAEPSEMMERKLLKKLGMKEWSRKRGALESLLTYW